MPHMTNEQRHQLLLHIYDRIFNVVRFPHFKILTGELKPGSPNFRQLAQIFKTTVERTHLDSHWAPWLGGKVAFGRTFKCAEIGVNTLMGFDLLLNLSEGGITTL